MVDWTQIKTKQDTEPKKNEIDWNKVGVVSSTPSSNIKAQPVKKPKKKAGFLETAVDTVGRVATDVIEQPVKFAEGLVDTAGYAYADFLKGQNKFDEAKALEKAVAFNNTKDMFQPLKDTFDASAIDANVGKVAVDTTLGTLTRLGVGSIRQTEGLTDFATYRLADVADLVGKKDIAKKLRDNAMFDSAGTLSKQNEETFKQNLISRDNAIGSFLADVTEGAGSMVTLFAINGMLPSKIQNINLGLKMPLTAVISGAGSAEGYGRQIGAKGLPLYAYVVGSGLLSGATEGIGGILGTTELDDYAADFLAKKVTKNGTKWAIKLLVDMGFEGFEDVMEGFIQPYLQRATIDKNAKNYTWKEAFRDFFTSATITGLIGIPATTQNIRNSIPYLTQIEQQQIQKKQEAKQQVDFRNVIANNNGKIGILTQNTTPNLLETPKVNNSIPSQQVIDANSIESGADINQVPIASGDVIGKQEVITQEQIDRIKANVESSKFSFTNNQTQQDRIEILKQSVYTNFDVNKVGEMNDYIESLVKLSNDRNIGIAYRGDMFTDDSVNGVHIVDEYGNRFIYLNPLSKKANEFALLHELTHDIKGTKEYQEMLRIVDKYLKGNKDYKEGLAVLTKRYNDFYKQNKISTKNLDVQEEGLADILGTVIGDKNFIATLKKESPSTFNKVRRWINKWIAVMKSDNKKATKFMYDLQAKFQDAYAKESMVGKGIKYSEQDNDFTNQIEKIKQQREEKAKQENFEGTVDDKINQSMTMQEAKDMVQRAFIVGDIKNWFDEQYKNGDEWLNGEGTEAVALIIENDEHLISKYINNNPFIINEEFTIADVLDAYQEGTLIGKQKSKTQKLDLTKDTNYKDNRFYSPQEIKGGKELYDLANKRVTNSNRQEVYKARATFIINAHNEGYIESLGLTKEEVNGKLKSWANYTKNALELSKEVNKGVALQNKWTGIENSSIVNTISISNEDMGKLVKDIKGDSSGWQRSYITSTMLALDTHIDYSKLSFEFDVTSKDMTALGDYSAKNDTIRIREAGQNTVAHEIGHYIDRLWGRELLNGYDLGLTYRTINLEKLTPNQKQFVNNFYNFLDDIESTSDIGSKYKMSSHEVFARFVARFVEWTKNTATNNRYGIEEKWYKDNFNKNQYMKFIELLQQKAMLDTTSNPDMRFSVGENKFISPYMKYDNYNAEIQDNIAQKIANTKAVNEFGNPISFTMNDADIKLQTAEERIKNHLPTVGTGIYVSRYYNGDLTPNVDAYLNIENPFDLGKVQEYNNDILDEINSDIQRSKEYSEEIKNNVQHSFEYVFTSNKNGLYGSDITRFVNIIAGRYGIEVDLTEYLKNYGYDGIISEQDFIVFNKEQVITMPRRNLIITHSTTEDKLKGIFELKGSPIPSIAISSVDKDFNSLESFGDITFVFEKDSIDFKKDKRNEVFGADIYSPRFPKERVQYKIFQDELKQASKELGYDLMAVKDLLQDGNIDRVVGYLRDDLNVMKSFLKTKGIEVEDIYQEQKIYNFYLRQGNTQKFVKENDLTFIKLAEDKELLKKYLTLLETEINDTPLFENIKETLERAIQVYETEDDVWSAVKLGKTNGFGATVIAKNLNEDFDIIKNGPKEIYSKAGTEDRANQYIDRNNFISELYEFIRNKVKPIMGNKYIRNNKDKYTPTGNERKFEQLYEEYNLTNLVKAMKGNVRGGESEFVSLGSLRARMTPQFKSIEDIQAHRNKLLSKEEFRRVSAKFEALLLDLLQTVTDDAAFEMDKYEFMQVLAKVADSGKINRNNVIDTFEQSSANISNNTADKLVDFLYSLVEMETEYFEAKPQREVYLDEVKVAIVPEDMPTDLIKELESYGIKIIVYNDSSAYADRFSILQQLKQYQFSKGGQDAWQKFLDTLPQGEKTDITKYKKFQEIVQKVKEGKQPKLPTKKIDLEELKGQSRTRGFVQSALDAPNVPKEVKQKLKKQDNNYLVITDEQAMKDATARIKTNGYANAKTTFKTKFENGERMGKLDITEAQLLYNEAFKRGDIETARDILSNLAVLGTEMGQGVQALSLISRLSPEGRLLTLEKAVNRYNKKNQTNVKIKDVDAAKILTSENQEQLDEAVNSAIANIQKELPKTILNRINEWRYLSMLGNPKTHIKNMASNTAMYGTMKVKNKVATLLESILKPEKRTKTFEKVSKDVKEFVAQDAIKSKERIQGTDKYTSKGVLRPEQMKLMAFNSNLLELEDWWFSSISFKEAMEQYITVNKIELSDAKKVEEARQYAINQAQEATFRQFNKVAGFLSQMEHDSKLGILVGAIMPFKTTPMNIAKAGFEYSPAGIASTINEFVKDVKNGGNGWNSKSIDMLSKNITGSGLMMIGMLLAQMGVLRASGSDDDKEEAFKKSQGYQPYSLQIGNISYTLDWLSPAAMPIFMGAEIIEAQKNGIVGDDKLGNALSNLSTIIDPLTEMSMLQGLNKTMQSYSKDALGSVFITAAQNYVMQFIPTIFGQLARTIEPERKTTMGFGTGATKEWNTFVNQVKAKVPFLISQLQPYVNQFGETEKGREDLQGFINRAFENFLSPGYINEIKNEDYAKLLEQLYNQTGDNTIFPNYSSRYFVRNGEKVYLTPEEYTRFSQIDGTTAKKYLNDLFNRLDYERLTEEQKVSAVDRIYRIAQQLAKRNYLKGE